MSGRASRNKGADAEREVSRIIKDRLGIDTHRTPLSGGMSWKGDVQGLPGHHIEIKRAETLCLPAWLRQAEADAPDGTIPTLIFRQSRQPWRVVVELDHFLNLLEESYASQRAEAAEPQPGDRPAVAAEPDRDPADAGAACPHNWWRMGSGGLACLLCRAVYPVSP